MMTTLECVCAITLSGYYPNMLLHSFYLHWANVCIATAGLKSSALILQLKHVHFYTWVHSKSLPESTASPVLLVVAGSFLDKRGDLTCEEATVCVPLCRSADCIVPVYTLNRHVTVQ